MSSVNTPPSSHTSPTSNPSRPKFNSQNTQDRLREGQRRPSMFTSIKKNRKSVFREVGLATEDPGAISPRVMLEDPFKLENKNEGVAAAGGLPSLDTKGVGRGCTTPSAHEQSERDDEEGKSPDGAPPQPKEAEPPSPQSPTSKTPWYAKLATGRRPRVRVGSSAPPSPFLGVSTMTMLALAVAVMAPTLLGRGGQDPRGVVDAGPIVRRADSPTDVCARWAQQSKCTLSFSRSPETG